MSLSGRISSIELRDLSLSLIALVIAFSVVGERRLPGIEIMLTAAVGVGTGFILHELAHKYVALHYGYWAEYRANHMGLVLVIAMALMGFIFAAPGAVMIARTATQGDHHSQDPQAQEELARREKREELWISLAGPMTNILLSIIFFALLIVGSATGSSFLISVCGFALFINLTLAAFNLLPFGPLDGKKVLDCNPAVWAIVAVPTILAALPVYLGMV